MRHNNIEDQPNREIVRQMEQAYATAMLVVRRNRHAINTQFLRPNEMNQEDFGEFQACSSQLNRGAKKLIHRGGRIPNVLLKAMSINELGALLSEYGISFWTNYRTIASGEFTRGNKKASIQPRGWNLTESILSSKLLGKDGSIQSNREVGTLAIGHALHVSFEVNPNKVDGALLDEFPEGDMGWIFSMGKDTVVRELKGKKQIEGFVRRQHRIHEWGIGNMPYQRGLFRVGFQSEWRKGRHGDKIKRRLRLNQLGKLEFEEQNEEQTKELLTRQRGAIIEAILGEIKSPDERFIRGGRPGTNPSKLYRA